MKALARSTQMCMLALTSFCCQAQLSTPYASAQENIKYFNEALAQPEKSDYFRILVEVQRGKLGEHFWLNRVRLDGNVYVARLETVPRIATDLKLGQELRVEAKDVLDWNYQDRVTRTIYGHFNTCAEFKAMAPEEAAEQMSYWNVACKPKK
jgi:uncharacterized protein YegJ (DUF2314 family)